MPPTVSIVLIAYNQERELGDALLALTRQTWQGPRQTIVVDNMSTDGTVEVAESFRSRIPGLEIVSATSGQGPSHARNAGAAAATGEFVLFLDGDDMPADEWLERMVAASDRGDIIGGQLEKARLNDPETAGALTAFTDVGGLSFTRYGWVVSANMGVWRRVLDAVGPWVTDMVSSEDILFCLQAQERGFALAMADEAFVHYRLRTELRSIIKANLLYGQGHAQIRKRLGSPATHRTDPRDIVRWTIGMAWLVRAAPRERGARAALAREVALKLGRVLGSLRYGVFVV